MLFILSLVVLVLLIPLTASHWSSHVWMLGFIPTTGGMAIMATWQANKAFYVTHAAAFGSSWTFVCVVYLLYMVICVARLDNLGEVRSSQR